MRKIELKRTLFTLIMAVALIAALSPATIADSNDYRHITAEAPDKISAKPTKKGKIKVKWEKVPDAVKYEVYRSTKKNGKYKLVKTTKKTKFSDKKIHPKKRYYYKVTAKFSNETLTASSTSSEVVTAKLKIKKSFKVKAYAYSGHNMTKSGKKAKVGRIAVDPKVIKLGTWLYVEGYGMCQACDIGGDIKGKTIDVFKNTEKQARKWGVRKPKVYIIG